MGLKWFAPFYVFTIQTISEKLIDKIKTSLLRNRFCETIENSLLNIHQYWLPLRTKKSLKPTKKKEPKVGQNEPCPCGSGQKYKRCCGKDD